MGRATGQTDAERTEIFSDWENALAALAQHRNVVAKLSGFAFPALGLQEPGIGRATLAELAAPLIDHTVDSFGGDRLLWGSTFPMDKAISTYVDVAGALADVLAPRGPDLLARVFRTNALRAYRLAGAARCLDHSPTPGDRCDGAGVRGGLDVLPGRAVPALHRSR